MKPVLRLKSYTTFAFMRTATPGRATSTHPYDVSECTGHSSKPLESRRFPVVSRIRPPRSCGGDLVAQVRLTNRRCLRTCRQSDRSLPRLDRSDVCGVDPGASALARPPHALEPEGDTPRATSPRAQRPPGRSPSWSSTRSFRENVADKFPWFFPLVQPAV